MRAHGALREILGRYTRTSARELRLVESKEGKPEIDGAGVAFNLSHSADRAVVAVTGGLAVGVDIERVAALPNVVEIADRVLDRASVQRIAALTGWEQLQCFYREWTRHEAAVKCEGSGIVEPGSAPPLVWSSDIEVGEDYVAAVAATNTPMRVCSFAFVP